MVFGTRTRRNGFSAVLLAAVFALTLAGCGGGGSKSNAPVTVFPLVPPPVVDTRLADAKAAATAAYEVAKKALDDVMANRDADMASYDAAAAQVVAARAAADQAGAAETVETAQLAQRLAERAQAETMRYTGVVTAAHAAAQLKAAKDAAKAAFDAAEKALNDVMVNKDADMDAYNTAAEKVDAAKAASDEAGAAETLADAQAAQAEAEAAKTEAIRYAEMVRAAQAAASQRPSVTPTPQQPSAPPATQQPQRAVRDILNDLIDASSIVIQSDGFSARISHWDTRIIQPVPANLVLSHMTFDDGGLQRIETRQGVSLAGTPGTNFYSFGHTWNSFDYAGWMDHSFFILTVLNPINLNPLQTHPGVRPRAFTGGNASGTNPASGSATWRGAVIGVVASESENQGNVIIGDATIGISSFSNPSASVSFTNLVDRTTNRRRANMSWSNMPVSGGGFEHTTATAIITGRFYGPNHEEVGGIFIRDEIAGGFGARR